MSTEQSTHLLEKKKILKLVIFCSKRRLQAEVIHSVSTQTVQLQIKKSQFYANRRIFGGFIAIIIRLNFYRLKCTFYLQKVDNEKL